MEKKTWEKPEMEVVEIEVEDVIKTSTIVVEGYTEGGDPSPCTI